MVLFPGRERGPGNFLAFGIHEDGYWFWLVGQLGCQDFQGGHGLEGAPQGPGQALGSGQTEAQAGEMSGGLAHGDGGYLL